MKIVKLQNGNVKIYQTDGDLIHSLPPNLHVYISESNCIIKHTEGDIPLDPTEITATQILPAAEVAFSGTNQELGELLSESFFFRVANGGGGGGDQIIKGPTPPSDTSKFWYNTNIGIDFVYNTAISRWISLQDYVQNFSADGNLNNNTFFKIDNVRLAADLGITTPFNASLAFFTWNQQSNVSGNAVIYSGGNVVKSIPVSGLKSGALVPEFPIIDEFENISIQWQGVQTTNIIGYLSYKVTYIP